MVDKIMAYEQGDMDVPDQVEFFQDLIDTGMVWELQGHYGRVAQEMSRAGVCQARDVMKAH